MKKSFLIIAAVMVLTSCSTTSEWEDLIKKGPDSWEQLNGTAKFETEKGIVTGTTVTGSPNSFLCTKEKYGDFILEFDTWFDPQLNSGVQFRSESRPDFENGRVYGYQAEMDASERAWSGGIYDESRRGWLYPLDKNKEGQKALKPGEWNHYRIEAIGNSIRTWINGIPCADLVDAMTPSGFIALQVHSIGDDKTKEGLQVKWKNLRIITQDPDKYKTPYTAVIPQYSFLENELTPREKEEGWKLLWDGKTSDGWRGAKLAAFPEKGWTIRDGVLSTFETGGGESVGGGDIVTIEKYKNFELIADFNYTPGANSGIKYFVDTQLNKGEGSSIGCEYQILDDKLHPDATAGISGTHTLAALYDLIPPLPKRDNGPNQWNRATIIVNGNHVEHWLNGQLTVQYERGNDAWRNMVAKSKYKDWPAFGESPDGHILLQEHGNLVYFKNIKIREL